MNQPEVVIREVKLLSDHWYKLNKVTFDIKDKNGRWQTQARECYDRGNGAAILLYNRTQGTVVLTRQFRMPTYVNGNKTGMMIEACAGLLDQDSPEDCIRRETQEETGYVIEAPKKVFELYMSPGSVTEILHLFIAEYSKDQKKSDGGGVDEENENIEVLEVPFPQALNMISTGEIRDAKTVILLQHLKMSGVI